VSEYLLAIDQGTSSSRMLVLDEAANIVASAQQEFRQHYPRPGWVEHDPEEIWESVCSVSRRALADSGIDAAAIVALGITNQRETTVVWHRDSGKPVCNAIVWQDRRTAKRCAELRESGAEAAVMEKTGLRLDPYFSATKLAWILDNVSGAREFAKAGKLAFGTIDCFLLWRLTNGRVHATDASNASRTLLFNIHSQEWDEDLLRLLDIPKSLLPEVRDCAADFGTTDSSAFGIEVPVRAMVGDQQGALVGQAGFNEGMVKSTYGTGCFVITNTGPNSLQSKNQLLTTVAWRLNGEVTYGLEGSIFVAGSAMQWLRDELGLIESAADSRTVAERCGVVDNVHVVPAFAGLGAPYWDADARGAILGLSRDSNSDQIITATIQAVAYQTRDLTGAMAEDGIRPSVIRVDGGMAANDWFLQFLADILGIKVERPVNTESTVLGAACLAGLSVGLYSSFDDIARLWQSDAVFEPRMDEARRDELYAGWLAAVSRVRTTG
jgi:glycerol kinase